MINATELKNHKKDIKENYKREYKNYLESFVVRISRKSHTKAGGRIWGFQALTVVGDKLGNIGWAVSKSDQAYKAKSKSLKKAQKNMKHVKFHTGTKSFFRDFSIKMGSNRQIIIKKQKLGMGVRANPIISRILNLIGIENATIKVINSPDILLIVRSMLQGFENHC